jgi:hypothetical protein
MAVPARRRIKTPGANGNTRWRRAVLHVQRAMAQHLGGEDFVTTPERLLIRRIGVFEAELMQMEAKIALDRQNRLDPDEKLIDLYSRLTNAQRRLLESVGMKRVSRDVTPSLEQYIEATKQEPTS